ncbi:hypothetical protein BJ138DRAFT_1108219, partial [Hygrophoropsis aurantiaca]
SSYHPKRLPAICDAEERMRLFLVTQNAFPDPEAVDNEIEEICHLVANSPRHTNITEWDWLTDDWSTYQLFRAVPKHYRATVKTKASNLLDEYLTSIPSTDVNSVLDGIAKMGQLATQRDDQFYFWLPIIKLVLQLWFGDDASLGHRFQSEFSRDKGVTLSNEPLAFAITTFQFVAKARLVDKIAFASENRDGTDAWGEAYRENLANLDRLAPLTYIYRAAIYSAGLPSSQHPALALCGQRVHIFGLYTILTGLEISSWKLRRNQPSSFKLWRSVDDRDIAGSM